MADFFQTGAIATLHRLGPTDLNRLERELNEFSSHSRIALVLPCHIDEVGTPALQLILSELHNVTYLSEIVVGIDGANLEQWQAARKAFAQLPQQVTLLWNDGPRMKALFDQLKEAEIDAGSRGKGRNLWICFGYVLANQMANMIASHDCDILTYNREMLARLCYPVAHPSLGFDFCKGYNARFTHKLNGRVMRLLFTPLIRSLTSIIGNHPFLNYLDTFRYPLSGEVCFDVDIGRRIRIPSDWGVEVGMLAEVFRVSSAKGLCQTELSHRFDHKHQDLSPADAKRGLNRMATDVSKCIFRTMAAEGIKLDAGLFNTLMSTYVRKGEDTCRYYAADAAINGLVYERHEEETALATFVQSIRGAADAFLEDPLGAPLIPNWNRVQSALPNFLADLRDAVRRDNDERKLKPSPKVQSRGNIEFVTNHCVPAFTESSTK
jgi:glucosyl-3-phosphoglycerate synthase